MVAISLSRRNRLWAALRPNHRGLWTVVAVLIAAALYLPTYQTIINGGSHVYVTDVGEHQNALPRWGIIHHSSYPQWSALGSLFVTILRLFGVAPAAGVSLWALLWGLITVALLVWLAFELGADGPFAALGALAAGLSTSMWVNSAVGELHTMTTALTVATLLFALRFGRSGSRADLLWLVFIFSQGIFHQRSILLLAPAVLLLVWPHFLALFRMDRRAWLLLIGIALLAPLTYLYLPLRVWTGADWVFGSPGTWDGFWSLFFFNNAELVIKMETSLAGWLERLRTTLGILRDDLWLPLQAVGLVGLWLNRPRLADPADTPAPTVRRQLMIGLALTIAWIPNFLLALLIWENRIMDAQLAAKLPVVLLAGVGLALLLTWLWRRAPWLGGVAAAALCVALVYHGWMTRPFVLSITRDNSSQAIVEAVDRVKPLADGRQTTVLVPWGTDYWTLTYEQRYGGRLTGLNLVDHNARPQDIIERGDRLLVPDQTLYVFPLDYFEKRLGVPLYLSSAAPGVIEISPRPITDEASLSRDPDIVPADFDLENGVRVRGWHVEWLNDEDLLLTIYWQAERPLETNYSVAIHLVAREQPAGEADILDQADLANPVDGWYPTTQWRDDEIVRDTALLHVPEGSAPAAIRVAMYRSDPELGFVNSPWLILPIPAR